jgi:hypothetical protein
MQPGRGEGAFAIMDNPEGGKVARMFAAAPEWQAGFGAIAGDTFFHAALWKRNGEITDLGTIGDDPCSSAVLLDQMPEQSAVFFASTRSRQPIGVEATSQLRDSRTQAVRLGVSALSGRAGPRLEPSRHQWHHPLA